MKNRLIIVEGPQGTGKTNLTNFLRENIPSSNLYRLSGQKDKTLNGKKLSETMYKALLDYLNVMQNIPMDIIFDRTFFTEEIYCRLGYKEYSFTDVYTSLLEKLNSLNYEIYFIVLYLEDPNIFNKRLAREYHHNYQSFSLDSSVAQQNEYLKMCDEIENNPENKIKVVRLSMDDFDTSYQKIKEIMVIK